MKRGRSRVQRLATAPEELEEVIAEARLGPVRAALVRYEITPSATSITELFSRIDLLRLGADTEALGAAQAWGVSSISLDGCLCLALPTTMDWDAYVHLAFDEIRLAGAGSPQVSRRLIAALTDLIDYAPSHRRPALVEQLDLLTQQVCQLSRDGRDLRRSSVADGQGLGAGA